MHFNENLGRAQTTTKAWKETIQIMFPKLKHSSNQVPVEKCIVHKLLLNMYSSSQY